MSMEMKEPGFGQRVGQIVQMAYVVEDIHAAMDLWVRDCGVGPWFLLESFTGPEQRYRGQPATADIKLAMSFAGHMNIELIPATSGMDDMFTRLWRATVDWNRKDPVRPFA
jgi:hypothetical protein